MYKKKKNNPNGIPIILIKRKSIKNGVHTINKNPDRALLSGASSNRFPVLRKNALKNKKSHPATTNIPTIFIASHMISPIRSPCCEYSFFQSLSSSKNTSHCEIDSKRTSCLSLL